MTIHYNERDAWHIACLPKINSLNTHTEYVLPTFSKCLKSIAFKPNYRYICDKSNFHLVEHKQSFHFLVY